MTSSGPIAKSTLFDRLIGWHKISSKTKMADCPLRSWRRHKFVCLIVRERTIALDTLQIRLHQSTQLCHSSARMVTVEQLTSEFPFQSSNSIGERRLGHIAAFRGAAKIQFTAQREKVLNLVQIHGLNLPK
jgi:hypothetical protein